MNADQPIKETHPQAAPETWIGKSGMGVTVTLGVYLNLEALYADNGLFLEEHQEAIDSLILAEWLVGQLSAPRSANAI